MDEEIMDIEHLDKRGLKIINEYNLKSITESILDINNIRDINYIHWDIDLFRIPVCLKLYKCKEFNHKFVIRISYLPFYLDYYAWPGNDANFKKFLSLFALVSRQDSYMRQQQEEIELFRKILGYIELGNNNKHFLIGKKYDLK